MFLCLTPLNNISVIIYLVDGAISLGSWSTQRKEHTCLKLLTMPQITNKLYFTRLFEVGIKLAPLVLIVIDCIWMLNLTTIRSQTWSSLVFLEYNGLLILT